MLYSCGRAGRQKFEINFWAVTHRANVNNLCGRAGVENGQDLSSSLSMISHPVA
jgi:hypothetical protein